MNTEEPQQYSAVMILGTILLVFGPQVWFMWGIWREDGFNAIIPNFIVMLLTLVFGVAGARRNRRLEHERNNPRPSQAQTVETEKRWGGTIFRGAVVVLFFGIFALPDHLSEQVFPIFVGLVLGGMLLWFFINEWRENTQARARGRVERSYIQSTPQEFEALPPPDVGAERSPSS
jgi:hypothetical protein